MERERKEQREERRGKELAQGKHEKSAAVLWWRGTPWDVLRVHQIKVMV